MIEQPGRSIYARAVAKRRFEGKGIRVAMTVSTSDLDSGRGDLYVAIGLGRHFETLGYEVLYLPPERWYDLADETDLIVSMVAEPKLTLDLARFRNQRARLVAWVRNNTHRWGPSPDLPLYDGILCSSARTLDRLRTSYEGPMEVLPLGVDPGLFGTADDGERAGVVSTVNQWGKPRATYTGLAAEIGTLELPLDIYGVQRGLPEGLERFARGPISFFAVPTLYRGALLVLDDQQVANRPFGNVNSRIYESLASGALPITNSELGLGELGLAGVPTYDDEATLATLVDHWLARPAEVEQRARALRRSVLNDHSYQARASSLDAFVRAHAGPGRTRRRARTLGFFPDYRVTNPYQDMLYTECREFARTPVGSPWELVETQPQETREDVFHIHWTATILGPARSEADARWLAGRFVEGLAALRARGGRIVWTLHNLIPHECRFPGVEAELGQQIAAHCDAVHVMCEQTIEAARPFFELPQDRTRVIPHPSYVDVYPNEIGEQEARRRLELPADSTVLLCLGQVRAYKGIERLLDSFASARHRDERLRLIVAGQPGRFPGVKPLMERCTAQDGVTTRFEQVADDELQVYLNAADAVVLPHVKVLNSGLAMLALSFARPLIAPRTGCLEELVTPDIGTSFEADEASLTAALGAADQLKTEERRAAASALAVERHPSRISQQFRRLLQDL